MRNLQASAKPCNGTDTYLYWYTTNENALSHFEIERSINGRNWQNAGSVPAAGFSQQRHNYKFIEEHVFQPFSKQRPAILIA